MWADPTTNGETVAWSIATTIAAGLIWAGYWHPKQYRFVVLLSATLSTIVMMTMLGYLWGLDATMKALLPLVDPDNIKSVRSAFAENNWLFTRLLLVSFGIVSFGSWVAGLLDVIGITASNRERPSGQN